LIIVIVQLGAVKIYVAAVSEGAEEKGKIGWNSVYHQNWLFSEFHPPLNANVRHGVKGSPFFLYLMNKSNYVLF
jgi:hypothetical protein